MIDFIMLAALIGIGLLILDCVEVGRNDAANLINAVFGARILSRRTAVAIAAVAVVLGATFSAPVMETARKGIFDPTVLTIEMAVCIYISVYIVNTVLLYAFSGFGMPVSTTACLVFGLVGASWFLAGFDNVTWPTVGKVTGGIVVSIVASGVVSFMFMRIFRAAIRDKVTERATVLLHGPWIAGAIITFLVWFMIFKGLSQISQIKTLREKTFGEFGEFNTLIATWAVCTLAVHLILVFTHRFGYKYLFSATAVLGMICMGFAFGQNDLANAASPGLATFTLWQNGGAASDLADLVSKIPIPVWALFGCGVLMASGMFSSYAQRVTRAEINTGSQYDTVSLYAPVWCQSLAGHLLHFRIWFFWIVFRVEAAPRKSLAPEPELSDQGKKLHYDALRATVITGVSASVIAFASGLSLPVSTTYVAFAAVLGTGFADRVFSRGDANLKIGRAIWVITCWFIAPVIAIVATGCVAQLVYQLSTPGLAICLVGMFATRFFFRHRADAHEQALRENKPSTIDN